MKIINNKIIFTFLLISLTSPSSWARAIGLVTEVKGHVFSLVNGKAQDVRSGTVLQVGTELITEEGSQITFTDYYDHRYHLAGSGQIKLVDQAFELTRGHLWIQSYNQDEEFRLQTANSETSFKTGEAILSFDSVSGKSQLLVVSGFFDFSNILDRHLKLSLKAGEFSFVDNEYNKGVPRKATKIGYESYRQVTHLFKDVKTMDSYSAPFPERKKLTPIKKVIADVEMKKDPEVKKDPLAGVIFIKATQAKRAPASVHMVKKKQKKFKKSNVPSNVKVKIFGRQFTTESTEVKRAPASVSKLDQTNGRVPASVNQIPTQGQSRYIEMPAMDVFNKSMVEQYKSQMRHSQEVNSLIEELRNYQSDFQSEY